MNGILRLAIALLLLSPSTAGSSVDIDEAASLPLAISGFGDFTYVGGDERFQAGQVEIGVESEASDWVGLSAALAYENAFDPPPYRLDPRITAGD